MPHNLSCHILQTSQACSGRPRQEVIKLGLSWICGKVARTSSQRQAALSSPNPTARGPWVFFFFWMLRGTLEAQSDRNAAVPRHTHTHWERWWQVADLWERRKIMSLWWHTEDTCFFARAHTHARTQTHKFLMGSRISTGIEFTKAALERPIYSARPPHPTTQFSFHFAVSLLPGLHRHTKLPTGIKAYINSRGPNTMNSARTSNTTSGESTMWRDDAMCAH